MTDPAIPDLVCDVVMKGGITSGVVYPPAISVLSQRYTFRNIGGTSAGAIAAAAAAAAEYGRRHGRDPRVAKDRHAFEGLGDVSKWLGAEGNLAGLFQARHDDTAPLLAVAKAGLSPGNTFERGRRAFLATVKESSLSGRGVALAALLMVAAVLIVVGSSGWGAVIGVVAALILGAVAFVLALTYEIVTSVLRVLPGAGYGLCSGMAPTGSTQPALSSWLTQRLNELAGLPGDADPLTFGHLWYGPDGNESDPAAADASKRAINLEMITSNLTHGRPYHLPFDERTFYFDPEEMADFFPANVIRWMTSHARVSRSGKPANPTIVRDGKTITLCAFPIARDLPIVVATRMSLSFPILLSAVRLYAYRYQPGQKDGIMESCWFSDGGITSNFPIHFFDALLPRWPTFGIDLRPHAVAAADVELARDNRQESAERWHLFEENGPSLAGFVGAIVDTMMNWRDNAQMRLPGYRDRVAHVNLKSNEGGLNLAMPTGTIEHLASLGTDAGNQLLEKFYAAPEKRPAAGWRTHRWVRFRVAMAAIEDVLNGVGLARTPPLPEADVPYEAMPAIHVRESPDGYPLANQSQATRSVEVCEALDRLYTSISNSSDLTIDAPRSRPRLRLTSRIAG